MCQLLTLNWQHLLYILYIFLSKHWPVPNKRNLTVQVTKSANYCCTTPANPTGLLLLCEVALGDQYCLKEAKYIKKLPKGKHSTLG